MRIVQIALIGAILAGCDSDDAMQPTTDPSEVSQAATVTATPLIAFNPADVEVTVNGEVTWAFQSVPHNVIFEKSGDQPADIPGFNSNTSIGRNFSTAGVFDYECTIHPGMRGRVFVQASGAEGGQGSGSTY